MKRMLMFGLFLVIVIGFGFFLFTYQVRFTESAVVTTFGKANEDDVKAKPGLKFRLPSPFQSVTKYDTRVRVLSTKAATQQTADDRQIVVEAFCTWRVSDPLRFYQSFSNAGPRPTDHLKKAETQLRQALSAAIGETSRYRMDQLFTSDPSGSKLPELEQMILATMDKTERGETLADYGIKAIDVGINRISLPEATTAKVFDRMKATRQRLAEEAVSQGESVAQTIRSSAKSDAERIKAFADRRAREIMALGDVEAQQFLAQMKEDPELAVFLKELDLLRDSYFKQATLVLPGFPPGSNLLSPNALSGLEPGKIPATSLASRWFENAAAHDKTGAEKPQ